MAYNLTQISTNTTDLLTMTQGVNSVLLDGFFGLLMLIGISVVLFIAFWQTTGDVKRSLGATSFISFGLALLLRAVDLVNDTTIFVTLIAAGAVMAAIIKR